MSAGSRPWTHEQLAARAIDLVKNRPDLGVHFGVVAIGDELIQYPASAGAEYLEFVDATLDLCMDGKGDAAIVAWQWPGRAYVTVMLACPADGTTSIAVYPPEAVN
jgi:hypothetical protein